VIIIQKKRATLVAGNVGKQYALPKINFQLFVRNSSQAVKLAPKDDGVSCHYSRPHCSAGERSGNAAKEKRRKEGRILIFAWLYELLAT